MPLVFLMFVGMPIIEIWVLIEVGSRIGVFNTIALVILTAIVGTAMLRGQGLSVLARVRQQMDEQRVPALEILEGMFLVVGGALLLTPGFVTDFFGFLCLIPATRALLVRFALSRFQVRAYAGPSRPPPGARKWESQSNRTLEGEYKREE